MSNETDSVDVGASSDFPEGQGRQVEVNGRTLSIFRRNGSLYALDHYCYHMGGPLDGGDIEDLVLPTKDEGDVVHPCVICPLHSYKISLKTGEGIYIHSDPFAADSKKEVKSRGRKQRTHDVDETGGRVMVRLNVSTDTKFASDYYATEDFKKMMNRK